MNNVDDIKNRIKLRRNHETRNEERVKNEKHFSLYYPVMSFLLVLALFFGFSIYTKKDQQGNLIKRWLGINVDFTSYNNSLTSTLNGLIDFRLFNNLFTYGDSVVSSTPKYIYLGEDKYTNGTSYVNSVGDGVVCYVGNDNEGVVVIIYNDLGFFSAYYGLIDTSVALNDRVYYDSKIGASEGEVKIVFSKDEKKLTYEEIFQFYR